MITRTEDIGNIYSRPAPAQQYSRKAELRAPIPLNRRGVPAAEAEWAQNVLIVLLGLFAPVGAGAQMTAGFDVSKVFAGTCLFVVAAALLSRARRSAAYPPGMWMYLLFSALHTLVVYTVVCPEELEFGYTGRLALEGGFERVTESVSISAARVLLFALTGWAIACLAARRTVLQWLTLGYVCGLSLSLVCGGYRTETVLFGAREVRVAGGFLDGNAFGFSCLTCFLLCSALLQSTGRFWVRAVSTAGVCITSTGLVLSGSRGAAVGLVVGFLALWRASWRWLGSALLLAACLVASFLVAEWARPGVAASAMQRAGLSRTLEDQGAGRIPIWASYIERIGAYAAIGVGFQRAVEALPPGVERKVPHNVYLSTLVEFGVAGLFVFLWMLRDVATRCCARRRSPSRGLLALFLAWAVASLFIDSMEFRDTWIILGACCSAGVVRDADPAADTGLIDRNASET